MKYVFEDSDIVPGLIVRSTEGTRMIVEAHATSRADNERRFALLEIYTGRLTTGWMDIEMAATVLNNYNARPVDHDTIFADEDE